MGRSPHQGQDGFTLLEVLIAFAILAVAVVTLIQLSSQGIRLLKVSGDHQQAVQLADRLARDSQVNPDDVQNGNTLVETGDEGDFSWERRTARVELPEEIDPKTPAPGKELPGLYSVAVAVRWGRNHMVEVATLRAPTPAPPPGTTTNPADQQNQTGNQTGSGTNTGQGSNTGSGTSGRGQTGPFSTGNSRGSSSSSGSSSGSSSR